MWICRLTASEGLGNVTFRIHIFLADPDTHTFASALGTHAPHSIFSRRP